MSTKKVLELNADFSPLQLRSWQHALTKIIKTTAYAVEYYEEWVILDGSRREYQIPSVIALKKIKHNTHRMAAYSKRNIVARDMKICQYCSKQLMHNRECTLDHVIPRSRWESLGNKGEVSCFENVVTSCESCNTLKANKTCQEAKMFPITEPKSVTFSQIQANLIKLEKKKPPEWENYLKGFIHE